MKNMNKRCSLLLLLMLLTFRSFSQVSVPGFPASFAYELPPAGIPVFNLPFINNEELIQSDTCLECKLNFAIDVDFELDFFQNSMKSVIIDGVEEFEIYRLRINSPTAQALNVIFSHFNLQEDSKLYIYSPDDTADFLGAFGKLNNKANGVFVSGRIWDNEIVIELNRKKRTLGQLADILNIRSFIHVYKNRDDFGRALECHENVICAPWYNEWCNEIRSVVKFEKTKNGRRTVSSAVLLNNTNNNFDPLILTAHHSIDGVDDFNTVLFYFNFQSITCNPSTNGNDRMFITGANVLDFEKTLTGFGCPDIAIMRAHEAVPLQFNSFYSGWNRRAYSSLPNDDIAVGIHHPAGDIKKFSQGERNNPLLSSCIKVNWDIGYTEGGSSGSPLFVSTREVGGVLSWSWHEEDDCEDDANFFYSKLSQSWDEMQPHLAPGNSDALTHVGIDPISACQDIIDLNGSFFPGNDWQVKNEIIIQANNVVNVANIAETSIENSPPAFFTPRHNSDYVIRAGNRITINSGFRINAPNRIGTTGVYTTFFQFGNQNRVSFQIAPCTPFIDDCGFNHEPAMVVPFNNNGNTIDILSKKTPEYISFNFTIFPNPTNGAIELNLTSENGIKEIKITDIFGKVVYKSQPNQNEITRFNISLNGLSQGVYFISVVAKDGQFSSQKLIINEK
ncbi:MAG: T9SS type A sorting domain-containing protein [Bacteroidetes bacterium]|nr:T9SS type A sorting domain-containing protein [Bacteroidota bacterium]